MRVLQINKSYYPRLGGVETVVKQLAEGLAKKNGIESRVATVNHVNTPKHDQTIIINGVEVAKAKLNFFFGSQPVGINLYKFIKNFEADIVHIHLPNPFGVIVYLLARPKGSLVITYHSDIIKQKLLRILYKPFSDIILNLAKVIVATSMNLVESSPVLKPHRKKISIIPLGINTSEYQLNNDILEETEKEFGKNFILATGRLVEYKGFDYLIKAMRYVPDQLLYIIGAGKEDKHLQHLIKDNNLEKRVQIIPPLSFEKYKSMMKLAKLFVFPSISNNEAFGIVQLEAMYFGNPVVSSDLPTGVTFVNQHRKTGLVTKRKESKEIAEAINELLNDDLLYTTISAGNPEYVVDNFSKEEMIEKYVSVYNDVLDVKEKKH